MGLDTFAIAIFTPLLILLLIKVITSKFQPASAPLPPGLKPLPLIGNLLDLPKGLDYKKYHKWCKDLDTDILYLNVLGTSMIILDTYEASSELLDKRSSIYSGRARMTMINELMGWDFDFAFMDYGETWRQQRKLMHQAFTVTGSKEFWPQQLKATHNFLNRLLSEPDDVVNELRQLSGEVILAIAYGIEVKSPDDPYINMAKAGVHPHLEAGVPGAFLVDTFPLMKYIPAWVPGADFKRKAREWKKLAHNMVDIPFAATKEAIEKGTAHPSFLMKCLDNINVANMDMKVEEENIKSVAGTMYQAGSDTTAATLASAILALLEYPEVLKKAQREIDSVVLPGNFPNFRDEGSLPYTTAIVKEVLRWRVVAPIGIPHTTGSEDIYNGYRIPAGSVVIPNIWAILNDKKVFPDPELFNPERFMKNDEVAESRLEVAWGYGRRVCSGRHMAFSTIWITLASMMAVFDIFKPVDERGNVIQPSHKYTEFSILPFPCAFKAMFIPRNSAARALIKSGVEIEDS